VSCSCHCASGTCDERFTCCNQFRYGQCNQDLACVGPIVCRVVSCIPPWYFDETCTTTSATANATALHDAPCLHVFSSSVLAFGAAADQGEPQGPLQRPVVGMEATRTGNGYWLVAADGGVFGFGDARFHGSMGGQHLNLPIVDMARTATGAGYWLVASDGGVFCFGDARFAGSTVGVALNRPIVGMAATPSGAGYWFVAADGGISAFGDARYMGGATGRIDAADATDVAARPDGLGYWIATET
jgi:hypothetical protein